MLLLHESHSVLHAILFEIKTINLAHGIILRLWSFWNLLNQHLFPTATSRHIYTYIEKRKIKEQKKQRIKLRGVVLLPFVVGATSRCVSAIVEAFITKMWIVSNFFSGVCSSVAFRVLFFQLLGVRLFLFRARLDAPFRLHFYTATGS